MRYGLETIFYRAQYLWECLTEEYKHQNSGVHLKKKWRTGNARHASADYPALMNKDSVLFDFVKLFSSKMKFDWI